MPFSKEIFEKLSAPFDTIKEREGHKGQVYLYVTINDIIQRLNEVFGLNWNFEILREEILYDNEEYNVTNKVTSHEETSGKITERTTHESKQKAKNVTILGRLSVRDDDGVLWIKESWGSQDIKWFSDKSEMLNLGNDKKGAVSDALKKCAELLGVALNISLSASKEQIHTIISLSKEIKIPTIPTYEDLSTISALEATKIISELQKRVQKV
jgi:hypothetical protein